MLYSEIKELTKKLRNNATPSEQILWQHIRNRKICNARFNRQYPLFYDRKNYMHHFFIADFYCHEHKIVIELDGKIHEQQKEYDAFREEIIRTLNLRVFRIKNEDLSDINNVIENIKTFIIRK
jgi:very-short-patch-repair endonuclease